jgi:hypothetical protein
MRDRIVSLSMRRSPRIGDHDYNVRMLDHSDLVSPVRSPTEVTPLHELCSYANDKTKRHELLFILRSSAG